MFLYNIRDYHMNKWYKLREDGAIFLFNIKEPEKPQLLWFNTTKESELDNIMDEEAKDNPAKDIWIPPDVELDDSIFFYKVDYFEHPIKEIKRATSTRKNQHLNKIQEEYG